MRPFDVEAMVGGDHAQPLPVWLDGELQPTQQHRDVVGRQVEAAQLANVGRVEVDDHRRGGVGIGVDDPVRHRAAGQGAQ